MIFIASLMFKSGRVVQGLLEDLWQQFWNNVIQILNHLAGWKIGSIGTSGEVLRY